MDDDIKKLVKDVIKKDLGQLVSEELKIQLKPFLNIVEDIQKGQDGIVSQLREDRKDINQIKISQATSVKQSTVIIENQNTAEDKMVEAVKEATKEIPKTTEKAVKTMFEKKPFLKRIKEKFGR